MRRKDFTTRLLTASWWVVFPLFSILVARLAFERGCADGLELLPAFMKRPSTAVIVAGLYLAAYVWVAAACLYSMRRSQRLVPGRNELREIWGADLTKVVALAAVLVVEQIPRRLWTLIMHAFGGC